MDGGVKTYCGRPILRSRLKCYACEQRSAEVRRYFPNKLNPNVVLDLKM